MSVGFVFFIFIFDGNTQSCIPKIQVRVKRLKKFRFKTRMGQLKIGVIGGGLSGLCVAKHAKDSGHQITIFEQTANIGGTWVYTDAVGVDEYGLDIHTSMYHNLR